MLHQKLPGIGPREGANTGQQFLIDDPKTILVRVPANPTLKCFGGSINRGNAAGNGSAKPLKIFGEAKIGDFDVIVDQKKILRLDIEVLNLILKIHQIERLRRFRQCNRVAPGAGIPG